MLTLLKIARWLSVKDVPHLSISCCVQDSRLAEKGCLFFALAGENVDGVDYLQEVAKKGAYAAVVPSSYSGDDYGLALFKVEDPLKTMHFLARSVLEERQTKVIGITGSVGKTTTRHFLKFEVDYHQPLSRMSSFLT